MPLAHGESLDLLANEVAPSLAMRAGLAAIELAFMSQDRFHGWDDEDFARWDQRLADIVASFRHLATHRKQETA